MWRTSTAVPLAAAIVLALLTAGAALAHHNKSYTEIGPGTADDDTLTGTPNDDLWEGSPGKDTIRGEGGYDVLGRTRMLGSVGFNTDWGQTDDPDADTYYGGPGKDILEGHGDGSVDTIYCGAGGADLASFDKGPVFDKVDKKPASGSIGPPRTLRIVPLNRGITQTLYARRAPTAATCSSAKTFPIPELSMPCGGKVMTTYCAGGAVLTG